MMEARLLLATIAKRFRFSLATGRAVEAEPRITLVPKSRMKMRLDARRLSAPSRP